MLLMFILGGIVGFIVGFIIGAVTSKSIDYDIHH